MKILFLTMLFCLNVQANFLPKNSLNVFQINKATDEILKKEYQPLIDSIKSLYIEQVQSSGAELKVEIDFSRATVNAFAKRSGTNQEIWHVTFLGGLMRHKALNRMVFTAILCHELGHHLGGAPKKDSSSWVSVEGQSDYFATSECLKRVLLETNIISPPILKLPSIVIDSCEDNFQSQEHINTCLRSSKVSIEVGKFLYQIKQSRRGRRGVKASILKRDNSKTSTTLIQHPNSQCRLDTYFEGSLCSEFYRNAKGSNPNCSGISQKYIGQRPLCWFNPEQ